ncbi:helix-turn-helix domain-containing protein [Cupriavidus oxalaticus]|uniref:helix-turn-helix transcriptional regulator n=1 Tax=Cupriavidus oxalaticus TaxID=96344 RepID=UPI0031756E93
MKLINGLMDRAGLPEIVPTNQAAALLNRKPRTLYAWSCLENGPIRPVRVHGRLGWRVDDIDRLLNGGEQ